MRRKTIELTCLLIVLVLVFSFSSLAQDEVTINAVCTTGNTTESMKALADKFNELHEGEIKVVVEGKAKDPLLNTLLSNFMTKTGAYDVVSIDGSWGESMKKYLEPLDPYLEEAGVSASDNYGEKRMEMLTGQDGIYALPFGFGGFVLFYRKDLFNEAGIEGPPKTIEEYLDISRELTVEDEDGNVERYGSGGLRAMGGFDGTGTLSYFFPPMGVRVVNEEKDDVCPSVKSDAALRALKLMDTLNKEDLVPTPNSWDQYQDRPAFAQGKLAMSVVYSSIAEMIEDPDESVAAGKTGYTPLFFPDEKNKGPREPKIYANGWSVGIDKNSEHKEEAWKFIKFITEYENQLDLALNYNHPPTHVKVLENEEYLSRVGSAKALKEVVTDVGFTILTAVEEGPKLERAYLNILQEMFAERITPEEAQDKIYNRTHEIMTE